MTILMNTKLRRKLLTYSLLAERATYLLAYNAMLKAGRTLSGRFSGRRSGMPRIDQAPRVLLAMILLG